MGAVEQPKDTKQPDSVLLYSNDEFELVVAARTAELEAANARLREELESRRLSEERYRQLFENSPVCVYQSSLSGKFLTVNQAMIELLGYDSLEEVTALDIGKDIFFSAEIRNETLKYLQRHGEMRNEEVILKHKNGYPIVVLQHTRIIRDSNGKPQYFEGSVINITERKKAEEELRKNLEREKELNELKTRFISIVSHEFRTPLTVILTSTDLLEYYGNSMSEETRREHLSQIQTSIQHITEMLNDILFIEHGSLDFNPEPLNLVDLCKEIISGSLSIAQQNGLELIFRQNCQNPNGVVDQKLIHLVINNLLSNSIKYSNTGGQIFLDLICEEKQLIVKIQDQGVGIPPQDIPHLFEAFHRAENVSHITGTGLGLYTVRQAIEAHNGKIEVTSELGIGTTITVQLPRISQPRLISEDTLYF